MDVPESEITIDAPRAIGANLQEQGIVALIGRDVLRQTPLHYNGVTKDITLSI